MIWIISIICFCSLTFYLCLFRISKNTSSCIRFEFDWSTFDKYISVLIWSRHTFTTKLSKEIICRVNFPLTKQKNISSIEWLIISIEKFDPDKMDQHFAYKQLQIDPNLCWSGQNNKTKTRQYPYKQAKQKNAKLRAYFVKTHFD